jgi:hypothetical protein
VELILLESPLVSLTVLEVLSALAVEHSIVPVSLVLAISTFSVQNTPSALHSISEITFIPATIAPPKSPPPITLSRFELSFVNVTLFSRPVINSSSFFLVEPELSQVVITRRKIELSLSFKLPVVEISIDDFVRALEKADALAMRPVDLGLPQVDYLCIFEEFGVVK